MNIFNNVPSDLESLMNEKASFKISLKRYLNTHTIYAVDEKLLSKKMTHSFKGYVNSIS
jgi:hypothetical protein